jgi:hypothetical protein
MRVGRSIEVPRIEPGIGDHLANPMQHFWLWHLHQQRGGTRLADTDAAEQQVVSAVQFVDRVDCLDLRG